MKVGDVVPTASIRVIYDGPDSITADYKAPKGRRLVFMLLGDESKNESERLDPVAVMRRLGWVPVSEVKGKS